MDRPVEFKITKLPRNGPKPGQSTRAWLYGKAQGDKKWDAKAEAYKGWLPNRPR